MVVPGLRKLFYYCYYCVHYVFVLTAEGFYYLLNNRYISCTVHGIQCNIYSSTVQHCIVYSTFRLENSGLPRKCFSLVFTL